jgi:hypothetical protein
MELELGGKWVQIQPSVKSPVNMRQARGLMSFAQPMQTLQ